MADVVGRVGAECPETERWRQLGALERRYDETLAGMGRCDEKAVRIAAAGDPILPAGVEKIVVLGTPDPLPLALRALAAHAGKGVRVDVVVYAPAEESENFDGWGRPVVARWERRLITLRCFEQRVRVCANPAAQAEYLVTAARSYARAEGVLGVGVADTEVLPLAERALARAGIVAFNPEGKARAQDGLHALMVALAEWAALPSFEAGAAVLRCPDVLAWLRARATGRFSAAELLQEIDALRAKHLPPTLAAAGLHAGSFPLAAVGLAALGELRAVLTTGTFPENAAAALAMIFAARRIDPGAPLAESAVAWTDTLREVGRALAAWGGAELTPEATGGDVFLPEALRVSLGLITNAERFARDAYLLTALTAWRHGDTGRMDVLLGKTSNAGDPLRPSRLLLRCAEAELPGRVEQLFRKVEASRPNLPWARAWPMRPRVVASPQKISVTALRDWLACPLRFYLRHGLRMARVDPAKDELDAGDFGTLVHSALQQLGKSEELHDCVDADRIRAFLMEQFERVARLRYGTELTLPLVVQLESARQRLRATAEVEARERVDGWRTVEVEWKFSFPLGGLTISGTIDRIDRHADGRVRVLDYKTGDTAVEPDEAHGRAVRPEDDGRPDWMRWADAEGKIRVWKDLQLPMYRRAVAAAWGDAVACGYFNLPKAAGGTAVLMWAGFSRELQASAERCAEGVATAVVAGEFWPPREISGREADWDEFAELFHQGAAASVAREGSA